MLALFSDFLKFTSTVPKEYKEPSTLNQATAHQGPLLRPWAIWAADLASVFELTHVQHVNDGVPHSPDPGRLLSRESLLSQRSPRCGRPVLGAYALAELCLAGASKARTRLEGLLCKGFVCGEFFWR